MLKVGFIGWRGMVGSTLINRMHQENDFEGIVPYFFSTSASGKINPNKIGNNVLIDAYSIKDLANMDIIITCQGQEYTNKIYNTLRQDNWQGYWLDTSSALRLDSDSIIVLDPVNNEQIHNGLSHGIKNYIGGNCAITLVLLALAPLLKTNIVKWLNIVTYQAVSGAGAANIRELLNQMGLLYLANQENLKDNNSKILNIINQVKDTLTNPEFPVDKFKVPIAGNIIPWIDEDLNNGSSREEWKSEVEANKILSLPQTIKIDGLCVRVGVVQSHATAITFKLKDNLSLTEIQNILIDNPWINYIANNKEDSINNLTPLAVSGSLKIAVGRLKKLDLDDNLYSIMTVGDQLLWGAAEPIRRMLVILKKYAA